ncbi:MAG: PhoH family protein [Mariprofundaceae bacterium]|nr:PhoH family protein [Mariprofundaceae bacterium]
MTESENKLHLSLDDWSAAAIRHLCGPEQHNINRIEDALQVLFYGHAGDWWIEGAQATVAIQMVQQFKSAAEHGVISESVMESALRSYRAETVDTTPDSLPAKISFQAARRLISGKTPNQNRYLCAMQSSVLTLAVGPAGSGKTYLAVAAAVAALNNGTVERIILTRPAVEAGERLGFLPGDLQQKVDPYLTPLFDALSDMLGNEKMLALMEQRRIEIAPLAYMRGRTLNDAFVILDEAQNTTRSQMKMFLTRLGFSSRMVVTGDITQIDLPHDHLSGLQHAIHVLRNVKDVRICYLEAHDVVRHRLVEHIVRAYEQDGKDKG